MKAMGWVSLVVVAALAAGCASTGGTDKSPPPQADNNFPGFRENASNSSDTAGTDNPTLEDQVKPNLPVTLPLDQLPTAAQATVRREAGTRRVVKIRREARDGEAFYKVVLTRDGSMFHGILVVTPDGTLLREAHVSPH